ncbi:unnamed protein product [Effrenium voratum]|nr:unnamed protein product [Effrenium voratum]
MRCFLLAATLAVANANDCGELRQLPVCNDCDSETSRFACVGGSGSCTRRLLLAASVSCSGRHALLSRELRRGLELWAQEIARSPALGFWGERLTVQLWLVDDKSDPEEVRRIYANFSAQTGNLRPDALIGPFSSELSAAAAEATSGSGLLLLLPGASSPSVFRFDHLLGLCAPAPTYMVDALRRSQDLEPTSAVLAFAPSDFASTACGGAYEQAKGMGLKVLKNISWSLEEMTSVVQEMKALQPDLVIGCGYVREASLLIVSSMALDFNPKAFILTQASHPDLITAVEARNANFISGPSAWLPELGDDSCAQATCSSFRNGSHFSAAYAAMFGGDPAYQSAAAAAAGIVFLELVRRSEFYDPTELRSKALQGSFNTFYGRLTFNSNGMLDDDAIMARTVQLKPLPESAPPMDRYRLTSVKVLGKGGEAMEELPTWDQKRLMVYPCHDGYALQGGTCVPCEAGSYRHAKSTTCHTCERGTYSSAPGAAYCRPCPRGADCNHLGTASPDALPGFYRMPWSGDELMPWNFQPCRPASICLGGNQCAGSNTGTLCEQCLPGTTNQRSLNIGTGRGHCLECPPPEINITLVVVLIMGCVLYAGVVFRATIASALSVRHLQSIILKIVINYIVFAQVALQGTGFWSQIWNELQESTPAEQGQIFISYDCLLEHQSAWDLFRAQMNVTILLLPVALLTNILFCVVRNVILICRIKRNQRILERLRQFDDHSWNWTSATRHVPEDELMPRKDSMLSSQSSQSSETLQGGIAQTTPKSAGTKADSKAVPPLHLQGVQAKAAPTLLETSPKSRLPWGTSLIRTWGKPIEPKPASAASAKAKAPGVSGSRPELASPGARQNWFGALRPVEDLELVGPEAPPETWQDPPDINYAYWRRTRQREDVTASEKGKGTGKSSAKSHAPSSWRRRVEGGER